MTFKIFNFDTQTDIKNDTQTDIKNDIKNDF